METECLEWVGGRDKHGYGFVYSPRHKRVVRAHRLAWEDANQACLLKGAVIMHDCDNPACCNPKHLRLGSTKENMQDCAKRGRHGQQRKLHCPAGHPLDKTYKNRVGGPARICSICKNTGERARYARAKQKGKTNE